MNSSIAPWICMFSPLVGAALTPVFARINSTLRDIWAVLAAATAGTAALSMLPLLFQDGALPLEISVRWLEVPFAISFGVLLDPVSISHAVFDGSLVTLTTCEGVRHLTDASLSGASDKGTGSGAAHTAGSIRGVRCGAALAQGPRVRP